MLNIKHPIIFLDTTGPLISRNWEKTKRNAGLKKMPYGCPFVISRLQHLVDIADAQVVLTSSYNRNEFDLAKLFDFICDYGIPIIGSTPDLDSNWRQDEIAAWLLDHYVAHDCYVILDDQTEDLIAMDEHVVDVSPECGLTDSDIDRALNIIAKYRPSLDKVKDLSALERLRCLKRRTLS